MPPLADWYFRLWRATTAGTTAFWAALLDDGSDGRDPAATLTIAGEGDEEWVESDESYSRTEVR